MKKCTSCGQIYDEDINFCPQCGGTVKAVIKKEEKPYTVCPNCNAVIEGGSASFCHFCGTKIKNDIVKQESSVQNILKSATDKVRENEFVKSVKQDIENSQSLNILKDKAKEGFNSAVDMAKGASQNVKAMNSAKKKKTSVIAAVIAIAIVVLIIVTNIHSCEDCGKTYIGKEYTISFWGETEKVCRECYNDFYYNW